MSGSHQDPQDKIEMLRQLRDMMDMHARLWVEAQELLEQGDPKLCAAHQEYQDTLIKLALLRGSGERARTIPDVSIVGIRWAYSLEAAACIQSNR